MFTLSHITHRLCPWCAGAGAAQDVGMVLEPNGDWWWFDTCHVQVSDVQVRRIKARAGGQGRGRGEGMRKSERERHAFDQPISVVGHLPRSGVRCAGEADKGMGRRAGEGGGGMGEGEEGRNRQSAGGGGGTRRLTFIATVLGHQPLPPSHLCHYLMPLPPLPISSSTNLVQQQRV